MNRYSGHKRGSENYKKYKFYKNLKTYLCFVGFMLVMNTFMRMHINFYPIAFWWGFGIVVHYLRTFGWAGLTEQYAQQLPERERTYDNFAEPDVEEFVELKQPQRVWRDRDLV